MMAVCTIALLLAAAVSCGDKPAAQHDEHREEGEHGGQLMVAHIQVANVGFFERLGWRCDGPREHYVGVEQSLMTRFRLNGRRASGLAGTGATHRAPVFGQVGFVRALDIELREHGVRATNIAPGGVNTEFAIGAGREHGDPEPEQMMSAKDVAEIVLFAITRPRNLRILTTTFRPMNEGSWG